MLRKEIFEPFLSSITVAEPSDQEHYASYEAMPLSFATDESSRPRYTAWAQEIRVSMFVSWDRRQKRKIVSLAEMGPEAATFPSAGQAASWVGVCPGREESTGKSNNNRSPKGNRPMRRLLNQLAWAAVHTKGSYFQDLEIYRGNELVETMENPSVRVESLLIQ